MNQTLFRQLKDIQLQAEKLTSGNPGEEELNMFSKYNDELKKYVSDNTEDQKILKLINEIPNVLDVKVEITSKPLILLVILGLISLGVSALYFSYAAGMRKTKLVQENIHTARGKYASIEFLIKANH